MAKALWLGASHIKSGFRHPLATNLDPQAVAWWRVTQLFPILLVLALFDMISIMIGRRLSAKRAATLLSATTTLNYLSQRASPYQPYNYLGSIGAARRLRDARLRSMSLYDLLALSAALCALIGMYGLHFHS